MGVEGGSAKNQYRQKKLKEESVELVRRDNMDKTHVKCDDLRSQVTELLERIQERLFDRAKAFSIKVSQKLL